MAGSHIYFCYFKFKQCKKHLITLIFFLTSLIFINCGFNYNQVNCDKLNDLDINTDLQTHTNIDDLVFFPPKITVNAPLNNTYYNSPPLIQINITDIYEINQTWYLIIGSSENQSFTGNSVEIDIDLWQMQVDGLVIIRFYANNSLGLEGFTDLQIIKDTIQPTIIIHSPQNGTIVGKEPPDFNLSVSDVNFHKFWFFFNTSDEIYYWQISSGNNIVWLPFSEWQTIPNGHLLVRFFVNDTAGNVNNYDIVIIKQSTERYQKITGINTSILYLVLVITFTIIIISIDTKKKKFYLK